MNFICDNAYCIGTQGRIVEMAHCELDSDPDMTP